MAEIETKEEFEAIQNSSEWKEFAGEAFRRFNELSEFVKNTQINITVAYLSPCVPWIHRLLFLLVAP